MDLVLRPEGEAVPQEVTVMETRNRHEAVTGNHVQVFKSRVQCKLHVSKLHVIDICIGSVSVLL